MTLDLHQVCACPKSNTWTSPSTAPAKKSDTWTSSNAAPATKSHSYAWSSSHMKTHLQCKEQQVSPSNLTKYCACHKKNTAAFQRKFHKTDHTSFPTRARSENDPTMIRAWNRQSATRLATEVTARPQAFSIEKCNLSRPILHSNIHHVLRLPQKVTLELHQVLRLPRKVTLEPHQMLHLPRKVTPMLDPRHIWKLIYNSRSNRCHHPTSPNTAPATKKHCSISEKISENGSHVISNAGPIREWSEHETVSPQPASQPRLLFGLATSIFYWKIQRFAPNLTFKHSPSAAPATKSDSWTSPSTAPATKSDTWTSPNTAPAPKHTTLPSHSYFTRLLLHTLNSHS